MAEYIITYRDTAQDLMARNPRIPDGQAGLETDTGLIKIGDGVHTWNNLEYSVEVVASPPATQEDVEDAIVVALGVVVDDAIDSGDTTSAPSEDAVFDALATKSDTAHTHVAADITDFTTAAQAAVVTQTVTNGVTTTSPSEDAVFDAIAAIPAGVADIDDLSDAISFFVGANNASYYIGDNSGNVSATGVRNTAVGASTLFNVTTANHDTAIGMGAGFGELTGDHNTMLGYGSDVGSTNLVNATAIGALAVVAASNTMQFGDVAVTDVYFSNSDAILHADGSALTGLPSQVTQTITNGVLATAPSEDAVFDALALKSNTGHNHVAADITDFTTEARAAVVTQTVTNGVTTTSPSEDAVFDAIAAIPAGATSIDGLSDGLTRYGAGDAVYLGSGSGVSTASRNAGVGFEVMNSAGTGGSDSTGVGYRALKVNDGSHNTAVGSQTLDANTTGNSNTAVGSLALGANITTANNTAIGAGALTANTAANNTAVGSQSLTVNTTGPDNAAVGYRALVANTSGSANTAVGTDSAVTLTTGVDNVLIGYGADVSAAAAVNRIGIGSSVVVNADNTWVMGVSATKQAITEGADCAMGVVTLAGATDTVVANTLVTANSRIFLTWQDDNGGTSSFIRIKSRIPGTSFTISSSTATDVGIVAWEIKEPN